MRGGATMSETGRKNSKTMTTPDVTFIFAEDVVEWDSYLSRQFEGSGALIHHEQVEKLVFPVSPAKAQVFSEAHVVLVILSPAMVTFLDKRASDAFQFTRLLKPNKTIAMVCGASQTNISAVKNVLVSYDDWQHVEAKDKDLNMVRSVMEMIQERLTQSKDKERIHKPKFKLVPRKVLQGNGKVYVILSKPLDSNEKIRITLEAKGAIEVPVKKRNPYTLVFVIPDECIHVQNMVNVHVWCGEDLMGVSSVKCATKLGELYSLLFSVPSPYEFLCNTLGVGSLSEVDTLLAASFKKNLPKSGFNLLQLHGVQHKNTAKDEFPTLLHFAARYGLYNLVKELLSCPGAQIACSIKNVRGLSPVQLANHEGHNRVAALIEDFWKLNSTVKEDIEKPVPVMQTIVSEPEVKNASEDYDIPAQPVPVLQMPANRTIRNVPNERENGYMKMNSRKENIEPCQSVFLEEHLDSMKSTPADHPKLSLLESQAKLIEIMESYKKGASLTEVERLHNEWKTFYQVSDVEAKSTLDGLRNIYAKAQKAKMNKKHSTSFSELRQFLNSKLRRRESADYKSGSRRNSKDSSCSEKHEGGEPARPVSTLSVLSNTSSSSGSSFDRLSTTSAGSDSGHHSDFCDDKNNKIREKYESRYQQPPKHMHDAQKEVVTLNSKPPAPPPRPMKPMSRFNSLEDCKSDVPHYSVSRKWKAPTTEDGAKMSFSQPGSKSSTLTNDFRRSDRKTSLTFSDFCNFVDPTADYDRPPPPRPSNPTASKLPTKDSIQNALASFSLLDPKTDYDIVPPPLPLSAPPIKPGVSTPDESYDIPIPLLQSLQRSKDALADYDLPRTSVSDNTDCRPTCNCHVPPNQNNLSLAKTFMSDNTDSRPTCNCHVPPNQNNLSSVKSCCVGNKLSSLKKMDLLPSVPSVDLSNVKEKKYNIVNNAPGCRSQYVNVFLGSSKELDEDLDIPEEMAPPPPLIEIDTAEEHYKLVGPAVPVLSLIKEY